MTSAVGGPDPIDRAAESPLLRYRFVVLLAGLTLVMGAAPVIRLLEHPRLGAIAMTISFGLMLVSAVLAVSTRRRNTVIAVLLTAPALGVSCVFVPYPTYALAIAKDSIGIIAIGYILALLFKHLFRSGRVTSDRIAASLCIYLLLGVLWAMMYSLLDTLEPEAFFYAYEDEDKGLDFGGDRSDFALYYSFVTMTTLGYGDVIPANGPARMLASAQAIVGQIYLTVLVARLVGLHIAQSSRDGAGPEAYRPGEDDAAD